MPAGPYPLFDAHPQLREKLPRLALADLPTPVARLARLERAVPGAALYVKRDDLSSPVFGGNKTRKLELILGALRRDRRDAALTFGFAGSNHVAATALFCERVGVRCTAFLMPQPMSLPERRNLLVAHSAGAELRLHPGRTGLVAAATAYRLAHPSLGRPMAMIAAGGATPAGNAAYANAAYELLSQIEAGELPAPDEIFLAGGSLGTAAGLATGLAAAGLPSRVVAVRAVDERLAGAGALAKMARRTARLLGRLDPSFPRIREMAAHLDGGYFGAGYAVPTPEGDRAARLLEEREGIRLDGTYTAKAFAAFLDAARDPRSRGKALLFWHTGNAVDLSERAAAVDWRDLPTPFHGFFDAGAR